MSDNTHAASIDEACEFVFTDEPKARRAPFENGGARRDRTDDLLLAKQALSQLSYTPDKKTGGSGWIRTIDPRLIKTVL